MKIKVAGIGVTKFGELWDKSLQQLISEAAYLALTDSRIAKSQIEAIYLGNMLSSRFDNQNQLGALCSSLLGLNCPAIEVEAACASGGMATYLATQSLLSGKYQNVLVIGAEKMTDVPAAQAALGLMGAASQDERQAGITFPGLYALMAKAHMDKFGTTQKQLAQVAVKNHYHASLNAKAQFPFEVSIDKVIESSPVASPLTLLDCSPITDGAAALVLSSAQKTPGVSIIGSFAATDSLGLSQRPTFTNLLSTKLAVTGAYKQAGVEASDIDLAEVHDCFTIAEIMAMEDLGFCGVGQGGKYIESGTTYLGGKLPVNTSGGLKACGHPVGATGVKQIAEITLQLQGRAQKRQVKTASIGLTHNVGGSGATAVVHILQR